MMLEIKDLTGGYGSVQILNGASLKVDRGRIVALLGGNCTGKSTLLKATSGLIKPWGGAVTFDGERIDGMRPDAIVRRGLVQGDAKQGGFSRHDRGREPKARGVCGRQPRQEGAGP